jgi:hypothetical protein
MLRTLCLAATALSLTGCALPPQRPIWRTLVPINPFIVDGHPNDRPHRVFDQHLALERARRFVTDKLPSSVSMLSQELVQDGFDCRQDGDVAVRCTYEESRPTFPCTPPILVTVDVAVPAADLLRRLTADDVRIAASVVDDRPRTDLRGCILPL